MTIVLALAALKLVLHLATSQSYGYFIDELYYLACSEHLDLGYVDQPPGIALLTRLARVLLGDSLPALRFFPAFFGAATVVAAGLVARALGGGRFAQAMAALAVVASPLYLVLGSFLSMNALDVLVWTVAAWLVARIVRSDARAPRLWLALGLVLGLGLENKISVLFLGLGLAAGLLLTRGRRHLRTTWPWCAGALALALFLPHILWQAAHGWPTLEFMRNAAAEKNRPMPLLEFLGEQALEAHPFGFVLLVLGLAWFLVFRSGRPFRLFGWAYLAVFLFVFTRHGKPYYVGPIYPLMFAGGAVGLEELLARTRRAWPRAAAAAAFAAGGAALAPMGLPVLPVETFIAYQRALLGGPPASSERTALADLPQHFADRFGHEELVALVAEVYRELPPTDRARCAIYGASYAQAGAIDFFGPRYGLPKAISGHNSYWLWGPGAATGEVMIVIGGDPDDHREAFEEVTLARIFRHPYAMPWRNQYPIFVCRRLRVPIEKLWPETKEFI